MDHEELLSALLLTGGTGKIVLLVIDGLAGMRTKQRRTELHEANTPNLDALAKEGSTGRHTVVAPGITPGSGAGHLAIFGYDPMQYELGRGALSAAGIGFQLKPGDVAARVNFCTLDEKGAVVDRRAGRISTEENRRLCKLITDAADLGGEAEVFLETEREHRALLVLRGDDLSPQVGDTDPQIVGVPPFAPEPMEAGAERTSGLIKTLLTQVAAVLKEERANYLLLRGYDTLRELPSFGERYAVNPHAIAGYPMYIGISRLLGMSVSEPQPTWDQEVDELTKVWDQHDFFYIHQKKTDSAGEDGDFERKVEGIEEVDRSIPRILELGPAVVCVTGDHGTPSPLMLHSWHPVPFLLWGERVGIDPVDRFNEEAVIGGIFGHVRGVDLMPLMLAAAGKLMKFGA